MLAAIREGVRGIERYQMRGFWRLLASVGFALLLVCGAGGEEAFAK
jgi:hypothetical protein